jgi:hypothetical protein
MPTHARSPGPEAAARGARRRQRRRRPERRSGAAGHQPHRILSVAAHRALVCVCECWGGGREVEARWGLGVDKKSMLYCYSSCLSQMLERFPFLCLLLISSCFLCYLVHLRLRAYGFRHPPAGSSSSSTQSQQNLHARDAESKAFAKAVAEGIGGESGTAIMVMARAMVSTCVFHDRGR